MQLLALCHLQIFYLFPNSHFLLKTLLTFHHKLQESIQVQKTSKSLNFFVISKLFPPILFKFYFLGIFLSFLFIFYKLPYKISSVNSISENYYFYKNKRFHKFDYY